VQKKTRKQLDVAIKFVLIFFTFKVQQIETAISLTM